MRDGPLIAVVCASATSMFLPIAAVTCTVPRIGSDLQATQTSIQWLADAYPLALATLLLPAGAIADRIGRRRCLLSGLLVLTIAMLLASQANSIGALIAVLVAAGLGSGLAFPSTLATLTGAVSEARRSRAVAIWGASVPFGGLLGALLGGVVTELASWSAAFVAIALLPATCLMLAALVVPETRDPEHATIDPLGAVLSAGAVAALVAALAEGPTAGWTGQWTLTWLGGCVVLGALFVGWELRHPRPMLELRLFGSRPLRVR